MAELSVDIDVNTGSAVSNVEKLGESFEDAARQLLEIVDSGRRAGQSTEEIARDIARKYDVAFDDAKQSVETLEKALREVDRAGGRAGDDIADSLEDVERAAKRAEDAVDDIGTNGSSGLRRVSDTSREVGQEIRQNLGEGIANAARGDFESLADTIGDTLGGAVAGIGGLGTVALGVAGAAGLGALVAVFQNIQAEQEKLRERTQEWAESYLDAGSDVLGAAQITANGLRILSDRHQELSDNARDWGVSEEIALRAMAGAPEAIDYVTQALERKKDAAALDAAEAQKLAEANGSALLSLTPMEQEVRRGEEALRLQKEAMAGAAGQANLYSNFLKNLVNDSSSATKEVDELGNELFTLPDGKQILVDAQTGQATEDVSRFKGDVDGIPEVVTSTVKVRVDTSAWDNYVPRFKTGVVAVNVRTGINQLG